VRPRKGTKDTQGINGDAIALQRWLAARPDSPDPMGGACQQVRPASSATLRVSHRRASRQRPRPRRPRTRDPRSRDRRGWELVHVIQDAGRTGANLKRPGIRKALTLIARGHADGLVVAKLDRVSRSSTDTALLIDWFTHEARADFVALDVEFADTTSPMGKLLVGIVALIAEWERAMTAQRTSAALRALKAQGKAYGPGAVSDQTELASRIRIGVSRGFPGRTAGDTMQEICTRLNAEGVPTPRGGKQWRPSSMQTVLGYKRPPKRKTSAALPRVPAQRGRR
jgi:DNA invertase Pin-like site-specific DNA recombinase